MKKWLCVWLALLLSVSLTACGGGAIETESGATESPDLLDVARNAWRNVPDETQSADDSGQSPELPADAGQLTDIPADAGQLTDIPVDAGQLTDIPADAGLSAEPSANEETLLDASDETELPILPPDAPAVSESGSYTSQEDVALYLHLYQRLPGNFITKKEARDLGWNGGSLEPYAPGKCIGGDYFGNYEGILPKGRSYHECDIDTLGAKSRGAKRLVYSDDGLIYYTSDHYNTFTLLYGEE